MSATVFLAICILGCDVLLYFLFQWTYGEKRRGLARRSRRRLADAKFQKSRPIELVPAHRETFALKHSASMRLQRMEERRQTRRIERHAYERIAATLSEVRR